MSRQPIVVDLVSSSSSDEDDVFPLRAQRCDQDGDDIKEPASPDQHFHQLDEPMEIEEDEPFDPVLEQQDNAASAVHVANALESVLEDLESDEDEEFATQAGGGSSDPSPQQFPAGAIDLSQDVDDSIEDNQHSSSDGGGGAQDAQSQPTDDATVFMSTMDAVVMKSKYEQVITPQVERCTHREEGELSDDPSQLETDELWQQKQLEATYLREAQVAHRQASLRQLVKASPSTQIPPTMSKKKQRKLKRKLQEAASMASGGGLYNPSLPPSTMTNLGYPHHALQDRLGMAPPARRVFRMMPPPESSILRVHRRVVLDDPCLPPSSQPSFPSTSPKCVPYAPHGGLSRHPRPHSAPASMHLPPPPHAPPNFHHVPRVSPPQEAIHLPLPPLPPSAPAVITPPVDNESTISSTPPDVDPSEDLSLLESLRNAVKRSLKKPKVMSSPSAPQDNGEGNKTVESELLTASPSCASPSRIPSVAASTLEPSRSPPPPLAQAAQPFRSSKMVLGPNTSSNSLPNNASSLKPLTACTQTVVIQLSIEDCNAMRRRMQQVQSLEKESDPIANLKQKIAAREVELLMRKKSSTVLTPSSKSNEAATTPPTSSPPPSTAQDSPLPSSDASTTPASPAANDASVPLPPTATNVTSAVASTMTMDPVAVAQSHIHRLEKRIGELKHLISQKEMLVVTRTE
ncbi:hypothetical protein, variant [Aphanomyces invadans]|uniref:Uncharacterized protein n=1 Tax=Aphanomyces invadans TaxID=157072 RepID=A0A024U905_9STRA|nr:hypothetical protein H310_05258 [Aphanomyces invadans]XP_008868144.1 hypothetical protein, variant [Aphanomyces invadans]ETW02759.1 hypothetical protein H310_05258 [Aphanomyces invadans]ETW02760.1 hypothetical protein, variant [Aphanomyces invadans]|eukprot:XP_008868143.1 hypothetical protein H310_05258 [Aphanomyces invadans]